VRKQKKITIAFISELIPPATGGAGIRALRTAKNLPQKYESIIFTRIKNACDRVSVVNILPGLYSTFTKKARILSKLADVFILPFALLFKLLSLRGLKNITLFHSFSVSWLTIYFFFINRFFLKRPFIIELTLMGADTPGNNSKWWLFKITSDYCIKNADIINCNSPQLFDYMLNQGYKKSRLSLISNSYDGKYQPVNDRIKKEIRQKKGFADDEFIITTVGHVSERKGYVLLKEIIQKMPKGVSYTFLSVGSYRFEKLHKLKDYITNDLKKDGLENKLKFLGFTDPLPILHMSDLFIFLSSREGCPSAVIEAMACGLPVISKNIEGITEYIIEDEVNGYVLNTDNPTDYSKKILILRENPNIRKEFGLQAFRSVKDRFSLRSIMNQYIRLYNKLLS
jgi:glycosyltransferase involved in cell wall biosynthesis